MDIEVLSRGQVINGKKIRYVKFNNFKYILYTLNEKDEEDYQKLYINKIVDNEEDLISDLEWLELREAIPSIVKQIKADKIESFEDLDIKDIHRVNLEYSKAFKLKQNIVEIITKKEVESNYETELNNLLNEISRNDEIEKNKINDETVATPINPNSNDLEMENLKNQIEKQKQENNLLQSRIIELEVQVDKYRKKLEQIKIMIEQS